MYPLHLEKQNEELYAWLFKKGSKPVQSAVIDFIKTNYDKLVPNHIKSDSSDLNPGVRQTSQARFDEESLRDFLVRLRAEHGNLPISSETYQKQIALNFRLIDAHAKALVEKSVEKAIKQETVNTLSGLKQSVGGIDLTKNLTQDFLKRTIHENVGLIKILHTDYVDSVEKVLLDGFLNGHSQKSIIDSIVHTTGVHESTARFWAQDQSGKFFGSVTKARSEAAGFPGYIWRTQGDGRVRDIHRRLEGTYHRWDDPPSVPSNKGGPIRKLHPTQDYRCRCWAESSLGEHEAERQYEDPLPTGAYEKYGKSEEDKRKEDVDPIHIERARPLKDIFHLPGKLQVTQNYVENTIWSSPYEIGSVFKNGKEFFSKRGTVSMLKFHADECAMMENATLIHNHPEGTPFSIEDLELAIKNKLHEMVIIAGPPHSRKYVIKPKIKPEDWNAFLLKRNEIYLEVKNEIKTPGRRRSAKLEIEIREKILTRLSKDYKLNFEIIQL
jgi:SPP1 gp7 family putative phage head morphogenesis protein